MGECGASGLLIPGQTPTLVYISRQSHRPRASEEIHPCKAVPSRVAVRAVGVYPAQWLGIRARSYVGDIIPSHNIPNTKPRLATLVIGVLHASHSSSVHYLSAHGSMVSKAMWVWVSRTLSQQQRRYHLEAEALHQWLSLSRVFRNPIPAPGLEAEIWEPHKGGYGWLGLWLG